MDKEDKKYIYVVVRKDIPLNQQLVQACHSSSIAGETFGYSDSSIVLLGIDNRDSLLELSQRLDCEHIEHVMFFEPDWEMGFSSLATKSLHGKERKKIKKILSQMNIILWNF